MMRKGYVIHGLILNMQDKTRFASCIWGNEKRLELSFKPFLYALLFLFQCLFGAVGVDNVDVVQLLF